MVRTKIAFLYSEVAGYFLAAAGALSNHVDVLIIRWPVNNEAPFDCSRFKELKIEDKSTYDRTSLRNRLQDFEPDIVVCSGWMDKDYLAVVKQLKGDVKKVLTMDNHWTGHWRQRVASFLSPFILKKHFTHAWVPGEPQAKFARKLGFKKILTGFYCADTSLFKTKFDATFQGKEKVFPKRFLFVARYVEHKGIFELWNAFIELANENPEMEWELWCLGTGDQWENRIEHGKIKHFGFVQPNEMDEYIAKTGVYILPSKFEPWGVSVQEFAIAGFPLLLSEAVGSKEVFLKDNGWSFDIESKTALKEVMSRVMKLGEKELMDLARKSHDIGMTYTSENWATKLLELGHEK
ncbi:MAG: glycosyltransferase family 4 protein [Crocinitomicaceae bacterium]